MQLEKGSYLPNYSFSLQTKFVVIVVVVVVVVVVIVVIVFMCWLLIVQ